MSGHDHHGHDHHGHDHHGHDHHGHDHSDPDHYHPVPGTEGWKNNLATLVTGSLLLVALGVYWCFFTVRAGSVVVVKSLGAISRVETRPGLYPKWPWPIQSTSALDTRSRVLTVLGNEVLTKDKFNIIVTVTVGWHVKPEAESVRGFTNTLQGNVANAEEKLISRVKSARKQVINGVRLQEIISTDKEQRARFKAVEKRIRGIVQKGLDDAGYGLAVDICYVQGIRFPADVTTKVFERMAKERERVSERFLAEGRSRAKSLRDDALTEREKTLADAEAKAILIRGRADAEAAEAYRAFQQNPELANWLRKVDTLRSILRRRSTIVLPSEDPLDGLIREAPRKAVKGASKSGKAPKKGAGESPKKDRSKTPAGPGKGE